MGASTVTTITAQAASYNLTDLETAKDELAIPEADGSKDQFIERAITQSSSAIMNYCNRTFQVEGLQDLIYVQQDPYPYQTPGGVAPLQLSRFPIVSITSVVQTIAINTTQPLTEGVDYQLDALNGALIRLNAFTGVAVTWEALPVTINYLAGFGELVAEPKSIPATPGPYTVTVAEAATFSIDQGVVFAGGAALTKVSANPAAGQYAVDADTGIYTFAAADQGKAVVISYGYNDIPGDLVDAALRTITQRFQARGRDPMLMSINQDKLGEKRWWVGASPGQNGAFPPEIAGLLDGTYRVPVAV